MTPAAAIVAKSSDDFERVRLREGHQLKTDYPPINMLHGNDPCRLTPLAIGSCGTETIATP